MKKIAFAFVACLLIAAAAHAQEQERILLPVVVENHPGAYASVWTTEFFGINNARAQVRVRRTPDEPLCFPGSACGIVNPGRTFDLQSLGQFPNGRFLFVDSNADLIDFDLRIVEGTGAARSRFGAKLPVFREGDCTNDTIFLLNFPITTSARSTIRIYAFDHAPGFVMVRVFRIFEDTPSAEIFVQLDAPSDPNLAPATKSIDLGTLVQPIASSIRYRAEVTSLSPSIPICAFASVTSNATQDVTIITAH